MLSSSERGAPPRAWLRDRIDRGTVLILATGLVAGVLAKVADESGVGWLSDLGTFFAFWVLVLVLIAWRADSVLSAALRGVLFFLGLTVGYYAFSVLILGFPGGQLARRWATLAITAVPLLAAGVRWASRESGWVAAGVVAVVAALAMFDGHTVALMRDLTGSGMPPGMVRRPVQAFVEVGTAVLAIALVARDWRTRALAITLLFPAIWVMPEIMDRSMRLVVR